MKRQFIATYQQTINLIKQLKNSNDTLNRTIGIDNLDTIYKKIKIEESIIRDIVIKIDQFIQKLQQTYLDPDTARKIGTAKQQYRIQKDRRKQLLHNVNYDENTVIQQNSKKYESESFNSSLITNDSFERNPESSGRNRNNNRQSQFITESSNSSIHHDQQGNIEFQMQRKIMLQRNIQINNVTKSILNVQSIMNETSELVQEQGQKLDIIGDQLFTTYRNVHAARQNLVEANEHQKKARRKYIFMSMLILVLVAIGAIIIFV